MPRVGEVCIALAIAQFRNWYRARGGNTQRRHVLWLSVPARTRPERMVHRRPGLGVVTRVLFLDSSVLHHHRSCCWCCHCTQPRTTGRNPEFPKLFVSWQRTMFARLIFIFRLIYTQPNRDIEDDWSSYDVRTHISEEIGISRSES